MMKGAALGVGLSLLLFCLAFAVRASCGGGAVGREAAPPKALEAEEPELSGQAIRLVHADGSPAAGIAAYGVQIDVQNPLEPWVIRPAMPVEPSAATPSRWSVADAEGIVRVEPASIVAARLTSDAIAVLPLAGGDGIAVLPQLATVQLELVVPMGFEPASANLVLHSADLPSWMVEGKEAPAGGFAETHEVHGWSVPEPRALVWRALRLASDAPATGIRLPRGSYALEDAGGTSELWVRARSFEVGSDRKLLVHLYLPPLAEVSGIDPRSGQLRRPKTIRLAGFVRGYDTSAQVGWPLRWRIDGEVVRVALENQQGAMPLGGDADSDDSYGLRVTWEDGMESGTGMMSRGELEGPLELVDMVRR